MTVEDLKRYQKLESEIELLDEEIAELKNHHTMDVVKSSDSEFPYTEHTQKIYGNTGSALSQIADKQREKAKLEILKAEIENFIDGITDNTTRKIFKLRYIEGKTWTEVAKKVGGNNTKDSVRIMSTRFLKKLSKK